MGVQEEGSGTCGSRGIDVDGTAKWKAVLVGVSGAG